MKTSTSISLEAGLLGKAREMAQRERRSLSAQIEMWIVERAEALGLALDPDPAQALDPAPDLDLGLDLKRNPAAPAKARPAGVRPGHGAATEAKPVTKPAAATEAKPGNAGIGERRPARGRDDLPRGGGKEGR